METFIKVAKASLSINMQLTETPVTRLITL